LRVASAMVRHPRCAVQRLALDPDLDETTMSAAWSPLHSIAEESEVRWYRGFVPKAVLKRHS
jgi:hypothetical protein